MTRSERKLLKDRVDRALKLYKEAKEALYYNFISKTRLKFQPVGATEYNLYFNKRSKHIDYVGYCLDVELGRRIITRYERAKKLYEGRTAQRDKALYPERERRRLKEEKQKTLEKLNKDFKDVEYALKTFENFDKRQAEVLQEVARFSLDIGCLDPFALGTQELWRSNIKKPINVPLICHKAKKFYRVYAVGTVNHLTEQEWLARKKDLEEQLFTLQNSDSG